MDVDALAGDLLGLKADGWGDVVEDAGGVVEFGDDGGFAGVVQADQDHFGVQRAHVFVVCNIYNSRGVGWN